MNRLPLQKAFIARSQRRDDHDLDAGLFQRRDLPVCQFRKAKEKNDGGDVRMRSANLEKLIGRNASAQVAAMPPTRLGHISTSSVHPKAAAQLSSKPTIKSGTAALPCPAISAPIRNRLALLPARASAVVPNHAIVRG